MSKPPPDWVPVARWEAMRTLTRVDFLISVLLLPAFIAGIIGAVNWFERRADAKPQRVAVVATLAEGGVAAAPLPKHDRFDWIVPPESERSRDALERAVQARRYDGALILPEGWADDGGQLVVRRSSPSLKRRVEQVLLVEARRLRAAAFGIDTAGLRRLDTPLHTTEVVTDPAGRVTGANRAAAVILMVLLMMSLFVTSAYMAIGITGEKQARVTEVIVSAIRPQSWIDGKIVAFTAIGLVQTALWLGSAALISLLRPMPFSLRLDPFVLAVSALMFVLGMVLYISLFAMVLATIKDLQSTTKVQAYLYFLPVVPFLFVERVIRSPDAPWTIGISQVPFFSPFLIPVRLTLGAVHPWELVTAVLLLVAAAWLLRRAAGEAFRVAMLMYGKELSLPELMRWAKVS